MTEANTHKLGSGFALAVTIGGVIGLGILRTPGEVATVVTDPFMYVALWVVSALFTLLSASVVMELVGMTPRSGGAYSLVRRAYGPFPSFVIGWADWLSYVGDIALKAVVISEFATLLFPAIEPWQIPLAISISSAFALLQLGGLSLGEKIQELAAGIMALIIICFTLALVFNDPVTSTYIKPSSDSTSDLGTWSLVIAAIIYTYDGWFYAAYFNGEVKGGAAAVARNCIRGLIIVVLLYIFLITALAFKVPLASIAGSNLALASALEMAVSPLASSIVLVVAIIMLLAHQNLLYMSTPRILQALAVDGFAIKRAGKTSKSGNPIFAVMLSWALSVILLMLGGFEFLLHLLVFFYLFVYVVLILGVIILRIKQPEAERPVRAWAHPLSTYFCLIVWFAIGIFEAVSEINTALYAIIMIAISWPVYRLLTRLNQRSQNNNLDNVN